MASCRNCAQLQPARPEGRTSSNRQPLERWILPTTRTRTSASRRFKRRSKPGKNWKRPAASGGVHRSRSQGAARGSPDRNFSVAFVETLRESDDLYDMVFFCLPQPVPTKYDHEDIVEDVVMTGRREHRGAGQ